MNKLLDGRTAVVYGGGGAIGRAVARAFADEGATVHLVGRTQATLDAAAADVAAAGGRAEVAVLDALDRDAVDGHVASLDRLDVSFNLVTRGDVQGTPLVDMATDDLLRAATVGLTANFHTARAAARRMCEQGSGVILHLNSGSGHGAMPGMGSTGPADAAVEAFMRYLAAEVGPSGVRVCGIWTAGVSETLTDARIGAVAGEGAPGAQAVIDMIAGMSVLGRAPRLADVTGLATFLASDLASGITGSMVNATAGLVLR